MQDAARQLVRHGHFSVNGRKVNIPSFQVRPGDTIVVREKSKKVVRIIEALEAVDRRGIPAWIETDKKNFSAKISSVPTREQINLPVQESLIVELYSK